MLCQFCDFSVLGSLPSPPGMAVPRKKRVAKSRSDLERRVQARIRGLRRAGGWTIATVAERSGLSTDALARIESGERSPTLNSLAGLAQALEVGVADLVTEDGARPPAEARRIMSLLENQPSDIRRAALEIVRVFLKYARTPPT